MKSYCNFYFSCVEICTVFCCGGDPCKAVFAILLVNLDVHAVVTYVCSYWSKDVINFDVTFKAGGSGMN